MHNLNIHRTAAKFVSRLLTVDQKEHRVNICHDLRQQANDDPTFISKIIAVDETYVLPCNKAKVAAVETSKVTTSQEGKTGSTSAFTNMMQAILFALCLVLATDAQSYCDICSDHTMCIYQGYGSNCGQPSYTGVSTDTDKQAVVDAHNKLRSQVAQGGESQGNPGPQGPAANMIKIVWDDELAIVAQRWADQCSFGHDKCRGVSRFSVGQNVYQTSSMGVDPDGYEDWPTAVQGWYDEVKNFSRDNSSPFQFSSDTGHYSQVVWADTRTVGCGFTAYTSSNGWYNKYYVCNYGPAGNIVGGDSGIYKEGSACTQCPADKTVCDNYLCA